MANVYYEKDADRSLIADRKVAVIGYGSQGHAHALNLKDSGIDVRVGLREGSSSVAKAEAAGLTVRSIADAAAEADLIMLLGPDTEHKAIFTEHIAPHLNEGDALFVGHGFSVRFEQVVAPAGVDVALVAPKGPGHLVRRTYTEGGGVPCLIAVAQDASGQRPRPGAGLRRRHRRQPGRRARHHVRGGDRDRPVRRAGRAVRRPHRARAGRVRDADRGRLPARVGLLRVPPRAEADRRPHVRAGHRRHALLDQRHRRVRRPHPGPADHQRGRQGRDAHDPRRDPQRASSPRSGSPSPSRAARPTRSCRPRAPLTRSRPWAPSCGR